MVLAGCVALGVSIAFSMKKRVDELKQIERIVNHIEGEIRYNNALIKEALKAASIRCRQPFSHWLEELSVELDKNYDYTFCHIWDKSLHELQRKTHLKKEDMEEVSLIGQSLGYLDIRSMEMGLALQKENLHNIITNLDKVLANNMKVAIILGSLGGIFLVVILI